MAQGAKKDVLMKVLTGLMGAVLLTGLSGCNSAPSAPTVGSDEPVAFKPASREFLMHTSSSTAAQPSCELVRQTLIRVDTFEDTHGNVVHVPVFGFQYAPEPCTDKAFSFELHPGGPNSQVTWQSAPWTIGKGE